MCGRARRTYAEAMRLDGSSRKLSSTGKVELVLRPQMGWSNWSSWLTLPGRAPMGQLSSLQDKVQTYVSFALDGQMGGPFRRQ